MRAASALADPLVRAAAHLGETRLLRLVRDLAHRVDQPAHEVVGRLAA
jgi:hypothetical protein